MINFIWSTEGQIEAITNKYLRICIHLGRRLPLEGFRLYRIAVWSRAEVIECHYRTDWASQSGTGIIISFLRKPFRMIVVTDEEYPTKAKWLRKRYICT